MVIFQFYFFWVVAELTTTFTFDLSNDYIKNSL